MRIGELAERARVAAHTIRYYEREGLIAAPGRTPGRYRDYDAGVLDDLQFIKKAQTLGLTLQEIREVLEIASGGRAPCAHVRDKVAARLGEVEQRISELRDLRTTLRRVVGQLDRAPRRAAGCRCAVIESLEP